MKPIRGNILTTIPDHSEVEQVGSIFIPVAVKHYNKVKVVTPDTENTVKEGEVLRIPKVSGVEVDVDGKPHLIVHRSQIILIE